MDEPIDPAPEEPARPEGDADRIDSREGFHRALLAALEEAAEAGSAELWLCDPDFESWPLGRPVVVDALGRWVGSRRRLRLIAADYQGLVRRHPRWVAWRQQWAHVVQCLAVHEELAARVPTLLLVPCVGHGPGGLRLGYGGGFYDRTLAALEPRPFTVGIGYRHGYIDWLEPEPHDIPLDAMLTEDGVVWSKHA